MSMGMSVSVSTCTCMCMWGVSLCIAARLAERRVRLRLTREALLPIQIGRRPHRRRLALLGRVFRLGQPRCRHHRRRRQLRLQLRHRLLSLLSLVQARRAGRRLALGRLAPGLSERARR